jgi:hypothetical protein
VNEKLQLSPFETKVVVRRTASFKMLQTYDDCIIAATLQVKTGEAGLGKWMGGSDKSLNKQHMQYGLHLTIEDNSSCGIEHPIKVVLYNEVTDYFVLNLVKVCIIYSTLSFFALCAT